MHLSRHVCGASARMLPPTHSLDQLAMVKEVPPGHLVHVNNIPYVLSLWGLASRCPSSDIAMRVISMSLRVIIRLYGLQSHRGHLLLPKILTTFSCATSLKDVSDMVRQKGTVHGSLSNMTMNKVDGSKTLMVTINAGSCCFDRESEDCGGCKY